jgi:hypothetical protein
MSKRVRVKIVGEIEFDLEDFADPQDIRDICGLDPYEAIEDEHIKLYINEQDVFEMNDQFGIVDADMQEVIVE